MCNFHFLSYVTIVVIPCSNEINDKNSARKTRRNGKHVIYLLKSIIMGLAVLVSLTEGPFFPQASWNNKGSYVTFKMQLLC